MKKSIIFIAVLALLTLGFTACEKESEGKTRITYYAEIILKGDATMVVEKGSEFKDPGFTATMKGEDVTEQVKVASDVDTSTSGVYSVNYSIANEDGFVASATRTVIVMNLSDPVEGFWTVTPESYRDYNGKVVAYGKSFEILIIGEGDGIYAVDDLLAGWYCQRAGYGEDYAMQAKIAIAADGTITLEDSFVPGWGDKADYLKDGKFDADTKTITYDVGYGRPANPMDFYVTLNKVEL